MTGPQSDDTDWGDKLGGHMAALAAMDVPRRRRRRDARDNDALILDSAVTLLATEGWHGLITSRLSEATGLSTAPIRERFGDRGEVASAVWRQRLCDPFFTRLRDLVAATPHPREGHVDAHAFIDAMRPFQDHDEILLAASELLIMARFDGQVADAVASTWSGWAASWLSPEPGALDPAQAARHGFVISVALGLLMMGRGVPQPPVRVDDQLRVLVGALGTPIEPQPLPEERAHHLDLGAVFDTDDPAWDALLQATLDELGTRGYDGATLEIIARSAGYSRGIIQNRYSSKKEIVLDATRRMLAAAFVLNAEYSRMLSERYSVGLADAAFVRESMDPSRRLIRSISFEQVRMAWHDPEVAAAMADEVAAAREALDRAGTDVSLDGTDAGWHFSLATGQGVAALADLHPQAADLPYDVVTVPLNERFS